MYADRHAPRGLDRKSAGIALALNAAAVAGLLAANPDVVSKMVDKPLTTYPVPIDQPPPPVPPEAKPDPLQRQAATLPTPPVPLPRNTNDSVTIDLPPPSPIDLSGDQPIAQPSATPSPTPLPFVGAEVDARYARDLQPTYPAGELRAERQGVVTVRVLIGEDGRVRQVERMAATSDAFFRATEAQALSRWRFRPATRGGIATEAWRVMTIRFVIPG